MWIYTAGFTSPGTNANKNQSVASVRDSYKAGWCYQWVLSQICCFGERRWCCFTSCWTVLSHVMRGRPGCLLQSARGEANRILLASALSSMRIICPNRVSRRDWIIAVSLGCFVSHRKSSFRTNWYHLMPSSIRRHHWSSASILRASVLDIAQQSKPYRNIGKMHVLYSLNVVEMASRDLQIWFCKLCMAAWVTALRQLMVGGLA